MKDQLEAAGYMVHDDRKKMFEPLMRYCDKKGLDFSETSKQWMYMYHDREGNHFYKHAESRNYLALSDSGRDLNSFSGKFLSFIDSIGKKELQIDQQSERLIDVLKTQTDKRNLPTQLPLEELKREVGEWSVLDDDPTGHYYDEQLVYKLKGDNLTRVINLKEVNITEVERTKLLDDVADQRTGAIEKLLSLHNKAVEYSRDR